MPRAFSVAASLTCAVRPVSRNLTGDPPRAYLQKRKGRRRAACTAGQPGFTGVKVPTRRTNATHADAVVRRLNDPARMGVPECEPMNKKILPAALFAALLTASHPLAFAADPPAPAKQPDRPRRPAPQARDPHTPGYVEAKELPDGEVPPADADGNFIIGPTHTKAPEMSKREAVPQGTVHE